MHYGELKIENKIKFATRFLLIHFNFTQALASHNKLTLVKIAQYLAAEPELSDRTLNTADGLRFSKASVAVLRTYWEIMKFMILLQ